MNRLLQDLRFGVRMLTRSPGFTAVAVVTLALGIGLNAAVFSGVHALLLRSLPGVEAPDRLVQVFRTWPGIELGANSIPHYRDLRDRGQEAFDGVAAWSFVGLNLDLGGGGEMAVGEMVSANFFDVMGVGAARGRTFLPEEGEAPGAHPVVVLSHAGWQGRFGGDPDVVGRTVRINGHSFEIVGIAPEGFKGPMPIVSPVLWAPLSMEGQLQPGMGDRWDARGTNFLNVIARLPAGASVEAARPAAEALLASLAEEYPDNYEGSGIRLIPQREAGIYAGFGSAQTGISAVLMGVVGLLLLIACVNVANLFLARAEHRRREIGIRLSVGAGRGRIVRQLLTESLLFALVSGAVGLCVAFGAVRIMNGFQIPFAIPLDLSFELSPPVLLFTLAVALGTGVLFGLAPALQASRPETVTALKGEKVAGEGAGGRMTRSLVVVQTALSVILLIGAALFLRNLQAAGAIDVGFRSEGLLNASFSPDLAGYDRPATEAFYRNVDERLEARPGVESAAWARFVPLGFSSSQTSVTIPGYDPAPDEQMSIDHNTVGPGYFETMGIPVRGRGFTEADDTTAQEVIVVNERMAGRFWPGDDAIGRVVETFGGEKVVVGVVEDGKYQSLGEEPKAFMYLPMTQEFSSFATLHVRATGDPAGMAPTVRSIAGELGAEVPVFDVRTMESHLGISMLPSRIAGLGLGLFGALGLLLASVGIYGVIAYAVSRRTREIGIRVALGAERARVLRMVVGGGLRLTSVGIVAGLALAIPVAGAVDSLLYTGQPYDPVALVGVPLVLMAVALVATWIPARHAARIDPVRALKVE